MHVMACYFWCHVIFFILCNSILNNLYDIKILLCLSAWTCTFHCLSPKVSCYSVRIFSAIIVTWPHKWAGKFDLPNTQEGKENSLLMSPSNAFHMPLLDSKPKHHECFIVIFIPPACLSEQLTHNRSSINIFLKYWQCQIDIHKKLQKVYISQVPKWTQKI